MAALRKVLSKSLSEKGVISIKSGKASDLDADHGDVDEGLSALKGAFVVARETPVAHEPSEGAFDDPAVRLDGESFLFGRRANDLHAQERTQQPYGSSEVLAAVARVRPELAQAAETTRETFDQRCPAGAFGRVRRRHQDAQEQSEHIDDDVPLAPFDFLGSVVADGAAVRVALDALAVHDPCGGAGFTSRFLAHPRAQRPVDPLPYFLMDPFTKDVKDCLPRTERSREIPPLAACFDDIENCIQNQPPIFRRASALGGARQQRFDDRPLGVGEIGVIMDVFHVLTRAALYKNKNFKPYVSTMKHFRSEIPAAPPVFNPETPFSDRLLGSQALGVIYHGRDEGQRLLPRSASSRLEAVVCGDCGFTSFYATDYKEIYEHFRNSHRDPDT